MAGHPARLKVSKSRMWYCVFCQKSISAARIPGIQFVSGGKYTLRLLRSIFTLSIDAVPNGFIAEGYDLNRDYVGELCRRFMARSEKEYQTRLAEIFAEMPADGSYSESSLLRGTKCRAIFSKDKSTFYTILPEEEIVTAMLCMDSKQPPAIVKRSRRNVTALFAYSTVPPLRRKLLSGLFEILQAAMAHIRYMNELFHNRLPERVCTWIKGVMEDDAVPLEELYAFLTDKENFRGANDDRLVGEIIFVVAWEKAKEVAPFVKTLMEEQVEQWNAGTREMSIVFRVIRFWEWKRSILEGTPNEPCLSVTEVMEREFNASEYSNTECFSRLLFYNEASILYARKTAKNIDVPIDEEKEDAIGQVICCQTGCGIPVACLEHLLNTGLLQKEPGSIKCFRHRQKGVDGCCTLECPFME